MRIPNLEYLIKKIKDLLGTTSISSIGDGTVTGAISSQSDQIANVEISNEYSSILDAVNAYKSVKVFPFTIQKNGNSVFTDLPTDMASTDEWNLVCYGSRARITLILSRYTSADATYIRTMFNGSYMMSKWLGFADDDQIVNLGNALAYVINGNTYSGATIPNGSFVLWNGVLYTANGAIPAGSVSASNFSNLPARGGLNSLNNSLNNLVHTADITVTTSNSGSASLLTNRTVIMACTLEVDYVAIPVKTYSGTTWVKVFNWNMQLITNTQVTIRYYYI